HPLMRWMLTLQVGHLPCLQLAGPPASRTASQFIPARYLPYFRSVPSKEMWAHHYTWQPRPSRGLLRRVLSQLSFDLRPDVGRKAFKPPHPAPDVLGWGRNLLKDFHARVEPRPRAVEDRIGQRVHRPLDVRLLALPGLGLFAELQGLMLSILERQVH